MTKKEENKRFRDGLVCTVGLAVEILRVAFPNSSSVIWKRPCISVY